MSSSNLPALMPIADVQTMAQAAAKSGLFGVKTPEQAFALMLVAQAEGMHPMTACQTYDIIQGRPSMKSQAMLSRFQQAGGKVVWSERTDKRVCATFSHPAGGTVEIDWTMERAKAAGLGGKEMWAKYPRQMLSARVVSEGVRTVYPAALGGFYAPEEVQDFGPDKARDVTPPKPQRADFQAPHKQTTVAFDPKPQEVFDVETGEPSTVEPTLIVPMAWPLPSDDRKVWVAAASRAVAEFTALDNAADVEVWQEANTEGLRVMMQAQNDVYQRLGAKIAEHHTKLSGEAA